MARKSKIEFAGRVQNRQFYHLPIGKKMKMQWWKVYLFGKLIDEVQYTADCDKVYVYTSLVDHDGYDYRIKVKKCS